MGCIYLHRLILDCPSNGKGYVGKAVKNPKYRWNHGKGYLGKGTVFECAILKYGGIAAWDTAWEHIILEDNIPDELLSEREKYWIAKLHTFIWDPKCNGYNMTLGGDGGGTSGAVPILMIDTKTLNIVAEYPSAQEAARILSGYQGCISRALVGKGLTAYGYYWCYKNLWYNGWQPREQIFPGARKVYKIDAITLQVVKTFNTITTAAKEANLTKAAITNCIKLQYTPINGYYYLYSEDYTTSWRPKIKQPSRHGMRAVVCIETMQEFDSLATAAKHFNTKPGNILLCCKEQVNSCRGKHFCFKEQLELAKEELVRLNKQINDYKIICIETGAEYDSMQQASRLTGLKASQISQCCNGKAATTGNLHWCYKKDFKPDMQIKQGKLRRVRCVETGVIYESNSTAFRQTGIRHIVECCKDPHKKAGGYHWEYVDKEK